MLDPDVDSLLDVAVADLLVADYANGALRYVVDCCIVSTTSIQPSQSNEVKKLTYPHPSSRGRPCMACLFKQSASALGATMLR